MQEKKTDLALEVRESFPRDQIEIKGVTLKKYRDELSHARITIVKIENEEGSASMKKPIGSYITIESQEMIRESDRREALLECICDQIRKLVPDLKKKRVLVVGLGNRDVTSDSLGPRMVEHLLVTRHLKNEFGENFMKDHGYGCVSALAPGVMAQTGIETGEILKSIVEETKPELVIAVDALAARSVKRLCTTVQITDTGIAPGAGVGNRRKELSPETLGVPVLAVGVPTVVDAETIIGDHLEQVMGRQGYSEHEIDLFLRGIFTKDMENVMVTPKNIDDSVKRISRDLAEALNHCMQNPA